MEDGDCTRYIAAPSRERSGREPSHCGEQQCSSHSHRGWQLCSVSIETRQDYEERVMKYSGTMRLCQEVLGPSCEQFCWYYKIPMVFIAFWDCTLRSKMQEKTQIISSESVSQLNGHGKNYSDDAYVFWTFYGWIEKSLIWNTLKLVSSRWQEARCWPETPVPVRHLLWWIIDAGVRCCGSCFHF